MTDHILGVDISKANLDVHLIPTGETQQFANSTVGFRRLIAWLRERLIVPLCLDAASMRRRRLANQATWVRPRLKSKRLPTLAEHLRNTATRRQPLRVHWYNGRVRGLQV